jgi:hypothetical protein
VNGMCHWDPDGLASPSFLSNLPDTPAELQYVLRKIDKHLMPIFGLIYMLQCTY